MNKPSPEQANPGEKYAIRILLVLWLAGISAYLATNWNGQNEVFQVVLTGLLILLGVIASRWRGLRMVRLCLIAIAAFSAVRLLVWRLGCTLNLTSPFNALATLALVSGETFAVFGFALIALETWQLKKRTIPEVDPAFQPSVDIYVVTYNEPLEILRRTICGAKYIKYPNKTVYVLDDGRRSHILELALEMEVNYITRPDNKHAKAGNINNALKQTNGDFVLILDADHIPVTSFLERTMMFFKDEKVGYVQTAHRFLNAAPIQRNLRADGRVPHEQELFFQISMVGKDHWNAAIFAGSAGVMRRSILDELGGMSTGTVIEDCEYSMAMHRRGYKSVYIPDALTIGMCPESLSAYLIQQSRWAKGQTQMLVMANPLFGKGLTLAQRLCYLSNNLYYLFGLPRIIYILVPVVFLLLGICATSVSWFKYMLMSIPFVVSWLLAQNYIYANYRHSFWPDIYEVVLAPYTVYWTFMTILDPLAPRFTVTPKGLLNRSYSFDIRLVWAHVVLLVLCLVAFCVGLLKVFLGFDPLSNAFNVAWDAYNITILMCAVLAGLERPQLRKVHRIKRSVPISLEFTGASRETVSGFTQDLSEGGTRVRTTAPQHKPEKGDTVNVFFEKEDGLLEIPSRIVRSSAEGGFYILEIEFLASDIKTVELLICNAYCSEQIWKARIEPADSLLRSLSEVLMTPIRVANEIRQNVVKMGFALVVSPQVSQSKLIPESVKPILLETGSDPPQATGDYSELAEQFEDFENT